MSRIHYFFEKKNISLARSNRKSRQRKKVCRPNNPFFPRHILHCKKNVSNLNINMRGPPIRRRWWKIERNRPSVFKIFTRATEWEISVLFFTKIVSYRVRVGFFLYSEVMLMFFTRDGEGKWVTTLMNYLGWTRDSESLIRIVYQLSQVSSVLTFEAYGRSHLFWKNGSFFKVVVGQRDNHFFFIATCRGRS